MLVGVQFYALIPFFFKIEIMCNGYWELILMSESDGEEGQAEEADQVRDTEESVEEAEPVLRRSTRYRRPPDRYGNPLNLPDLESDDDT